MRHLPRLALLPLLLCGAAARAADAFTSALPVWGPAVTNGWSSVSGGPYAGAWVDGDAAVFEGTATNVLVDATGVTASGLAFHADGWVVGGIGTLTLAAPAQVAVAGGSARISALVSGASGLVKSGAGTLRLAAANNYAGDTVIPDGAGTLEADVNTGGKGMANGAVSIGAGSVLRLINTTTAMNASTTVANPVTGAGELRLDFAAGTGARNTYLSGLAGFGGSIVLGASGLTGDKWNVSALGTLPAGLTVHPGAQLYTSGGNNGFAQGIRVSGAGNSENRGALRLGGGTLSGAITLLGDTVVGTEGGTIGGAILSGAAGTQTLTFGAPNTTGNVVVTGPIGGGDGAIAVVKAAPGIVTFTVANSYAGGTTVTNGTLVVSHAAGLGSGPATVATNATLNLVSAATTTFANAIGGPGRVLVTMSGGTQNTYVPNLAGLTGTLELSGGSNNKLNATGLVIPAAATIQVNSGSQLFVNGNPVIPATVRITGNGNGENRGAIRLNAGTISGPVQLAGNAIIGSEGGAISGDIASFSAGLKVLTVGTGSSTGTAMFSGVVSDGAGSVRLVKNAGGDLTLTRAGTYSGGTAVNAGRLVLSQPAAVPGTGLITVAAGAELLAGAGVALGNAIEIAGDGGSGSNLDGQPRGALRLDNATVTTNATVTLVADASLGAYLGSTGVVNAGIAETGGSRALSINKSGTNNPGAITLGAANTFSGPTRVFNGTLRLAHADALRHSTLDLNAADAGAVAFAGIAAARVGGLAGARALSLQNLAAGAVELQAGGNGADTAYSGALGGAGVLVKAGAGMLTLAGANAHAGGTVVTQGVLRVSGSISHPAQPAEVGPGATLALQAGTVTAASVRVRPAALLTGCGTINGDLVNEGTVAIDCPGGLAVNGAVVNHGRMRFTGGTAVTATVGIVNNGILDLITGDQTLPAGLVNNGTVLFADSVVAVQEADTPSGFEVSIATQPGHDYRLQRTADLATPVTWTDVGAARAGDGAVLTFRDEDAAPAGRRYYRFMVNP